MFGLDLSLNGVRGYLGTQLLRGMAEGASGGAQLLWNFDITHGIGICWGKLLVVYLESDVIAI